MHITKIGLLAVLLASSSQTKAGTFSNDFNSGTTAPAGTTLNGSAVIEATGGVNNSGALKLTKAINSLGGSFVIDDLDSGAPVYGFDFTANVRVGGGTSTPADGFSINFDPTAGPTTTTGEEGTSGGISFTFDIYDNGNETPPAPSIDVKVAGAVVATHHMTIADFDTGTDFVDLHIQIAADGAVSLGYKGTVIFTNLYFSGSLPISGGAFVLGARTGGLNENQWIDNLNITTYTQPKVGITQQLASQIILAGSTVTLAPGLNNADTATFQWFKNSAALAGATAATLTLTNVSIGDSGSKYKLTVTGPNNIVTTDEITLTVRSIPGPVNPKISFNFDDGKTPPGTLLYADPANGGASITTSGGVTNSGVLHLTDAVNGQVGAFIIQDVDAGAPVYGFTAAFAMRVGGGSTPPADGFSFNFGNDIPDVPPGAEDGIGTGLTVGFDIYDNAGGEAPSIDVRAGGKLVDQVKVPLSFLDTSDGFVPVLIRMENDGTIDVAYKGVIVFDNLSVPGFSSVAGGRFAFAARTGGLNENQWVDNLQIATVTTPGDLRITTQPTAQTVLVGKPATFSVVVNDSTGATFQWFRDGIAISGATSSSNTIASVVASDNGAKFKVQVTKGNLSVTSDEVALNVVDITRPGAPTVSYNFDNGSTPAGTVLAFTPVDTTQAGYITTTGGVNNSGVLHLVDAVNGLAGAFVIPPLLGGAEVGTLTAAFDVQVGGGSVPPADGFSFNFAPDLPDTTIGGAEDGAGSGITLGFDIYDNGNENPPAPSADVHYKGAIIASVQIPYPELETGNAFKTVLVHLSADGKLDVAYGDRVLFHGLQLPGYTPISNGKFGFYARTGGLNDNIWLDNVDLLAVKSTAPLRITQDISDIAVLPGATAAFTVVVSDPNGATYQWFKNSAAIPGATNATYTTPALTAADDGAKYSVQVTGPGGTVTSREAVVTVVPILTVSNPKISFNFDDGQVPTGAEFAGSATADNGDGILHLTDAVNGQGGSVIITDFDNGQPVSSFTAHFKLRVGGGTTPPADGLSFVWVNDLPSGTIFGEDGSGTGLIISFDIYDNQNETPPAPSIDVRYNGKTAATVHLPYQQMETGDVFADFAVRVEPDGTLDLQFKNMVIFNNVQLPGFSPMTGASFGIGARTGGLNDNQWIDNLEITTSTGAAAPKFTSISKDATGKVIIQWSGGGTLQSTDKLPTTTWNNVVGASSPFTVDPTVPMRFYRITQ